MSPLLTAKEAILEPVHSIAKNHLELTPGKVILDLSNETRFPRLSDALKSLHSIQVLDSGIPGDPVLLSIQGASSQQTKLLINGTQVNSSQWGTYNINVLPIGFIERVEIVTSSSSNSINQGIGGTINIITKSDLPSSFNLGIGSFGQRQMALHYSADRHHRFSLNHESFSNDYDLPVPSPYDNPQAQNQKQPLNNAEYDRTAIQYRYISDSFTIEATASDQHKAIPDYFRNSPTNDANLDKTRFELLLNAESLPLWDVPELTQDLLFSITSEKENFQDLGGDVGLSRNDDLYYQDKFEISWQPKYQTNQLGGFLHLNTQYDQFSSRHKLDQDSFLCSTPQGSCDQKAQQVKLYTGGSISWYTRDQNHSFTAQAASVYVKQKNNERNGRQETKSNDQFLQSALIYDSVMSNITTGKFAIKLGWERNVRIPTLFERFGDRGLFLGSDDLQAETSEKLYLNLPYQYEAMTFETSLFHRVLDNAIVAVYDSRGVGRYENTSEATMNGIEMKFRLDESHWYYQFSASAYGSATKSTAIKSFNDKQLPGIYHQILLNQLGIQYHSWSATFEYQYSDNIFIDRSNLIKGDVRELINTYLEYSHNNLTIAFSIQNLTNNQFKDYTNRPVVNRQWSISSTYQF